MREQNTADMLRRLKFKIRGWPACIEEVREEVSLLLAQWEHLMGSPEIYHEYHDPREYKMEQNYIQWLARTIYHLYYLQFLD
jgi:hypothetical protein